MAKVDLILILLNCIEVIIYGLAVVMVALGLWAIIGLVIGLCQAADRPFGAAWIPDEFLGTRKRGQR